MSGIALMSPNGAGKRQRLHSSPVRRGSEARTRWTAATQAPPERPADPSQTAQKRMS